MDLLYLVPWSLFLGFFGVLFIVYRHLTFWRGTGVPYIPSMPIIGYGLPVFLRLKSFPEWMLDIYTSCPGAKYIGALDFGKPVIIIKDPDIIREIGVKSFDHFVNHRSFIADDFDPLLSRNVFSLKDDRWREMRSTLTPSFTANKMKYLFQLVSKCSIDFVKHLRDHPEVRQEFDMKDAYTRYTNDVIATSAFGISVDSMKDPKNDFYENGKKTLVFEGYLNIAKFIAALTVPRLMRMLGFTFLPAKADRFFKRLVTETVRMREERSIVRPDMIDLLIQARNNDRGIKMTINDIIAQAFIFFLAGFDTSARLMCFVCHVLSHHPDIQDRLRGEVDEVLADSNGHLTYESLGKMRYMDMVISETLRLYPPMPFTDRVCNKAYTLPPAIDGSAGFTIQPDTTILIPVFGFHRDPTYFPVPDKFDPERFDDINKNGVNPHAYMPFGIGPRKCIGERFAIMEVKILVAHLLMDFTMISSMKTTRDIVFAKSSFNIAPENGFWMTLETRK